MILLVAATVAQVLRDGAHCYPEEKCSVCSGEMPLEIQIQVCLDLLVSRCSAYNDVTRLPVGSAKLVVLYGGIDWIIDRQTINTSITDNRK